MVELHKSLSHRVFPLLEVCIAAHMLMSTPPTPSPMFDLPIEQQP